MKTPAFGFHRGSMSFNVTQPTIRAKSYKMSLSIMNFDSAYGSSSCKMLTLRREGLCARSFVSLTHRGKELSKRNDWKRFRGALRIINVRILSTYCAVSILEHKCRVEARMTQRFHALC
jgi:hypothetical protein